MAEDEPKPGFTTPGETGLGHGATATIGTTVDDRLVRKGLNNLIIVYNGIWVRK